MKRRRRWALLFTVPALALAAVALAGCNPDSWNKPNAGAPSSFGPCGSWVDCSAHEKITDPNERCCIPTTKCWIEADGERSCVGDATYDPSNPVTWGAKKMAKAGHFKRVAHGQ